MVAHMSMIGADQQKLSILQNYQSSVLNARFKKGLSAVVAIEACIILLRAG